MSDTATEKPSEETSKKSEKNSNHVAGCGIFLVILAMVVFLISVSVYSYYDYKNAFVEFSQENITPTEIADSSDPASIKTLADKFSSFGSLVKEKQPASMELTKDEINLAIAHFDKLAEFRKTLFVTEITDTHIEARSSFPVNVGFDGIRHFNGKLYLKPVIAQGSIFPIVDKAEADTGNLVPEKVLEAIPVLMFAGYRNDETIKNIFHKITKVELKDGKLLISSDPASTETAIIDMDVSEEANLGLQLFGLLTFIFVTTIAFALWFAKFRKKQKSAN